MTELKTNFNEEIGVLRKSCSFFEGYQLAQKIVMLTYLFELRRRLLQVIAVFIALFILFFFLTPELFRVLMRPLLRVLPEHDTLVATQITSPVFTPIKIAIDAAMLSTAPYALFQSWRFASPGLYRRERAILRGAIIASLLLFSAGVLFCFFVALPVMLQFFAQSLPAGVRFMPDIVYAVDFMTRMLLIFGFSFQVPLVCLLLVSLKVIHLSTLKTVRPYVIVGAFTLGMLLTPPDVVSQIMLAVPLCLLYELGILLVILGFRGKYSRLNFK